MPVHLQWEPIVEVTTKSAMIESRVWEMTAVKKPEQLDSLGCVCPHDSVSQKGLWGQRRETKSASKSLTFTMMLI